jgi:hypothetical protein
MATLSTPSQFFFSPFLPSRPSPLSPRSANAFAAIPQNPFTFAMSGSENAVSNTQKPVSYSQRAVRVNPFANRNRNEQLERRRNMFLRRVEQSREDKKWEGRTDQVCELSLRFI